MVRCFSTPPNLTFPNIVDSRNVTQRPSDSAESEAGAADPMLAAQRGSERTLDHHVRLGAETILGRSGPRVSTTRQGLG